MNAWAPARSPASFAAWPWRGLRWAVLLAVLAHLAVGMLATGRFAISLPSSGDNAALNTRMIEPTPAALPAPVQAPSQAKEPAPKAASARKPLEPTRADSDPVISEAQIKNESNQPPALIDTAQAATETVAISAPVVPTVESDLTASVAPAGVALAGSGLKLNYPASAQLQFDGVFMSKGSATNGSGVLHWKNDGSNYQVSLEASALLILSRTEKSEGILLPQGLTPQRYSSVRTGRSEQATHFLTEQGKIKFSNNKPEAMLLAGAQDRLSALIQLAGMVGGDPERYKTLGRIQMQVADLDKAEIWEFNLEGAGDLNVPGTSLQAFKITRTPRNEFDQRLEIWLSPQHGYLPVRIRQSSATTPDQDFTDLVLRSLPPSS